MRKINIEGYRCCHALRQTLRHFFTVLTVFFLHRMPSSKAFCAFEEGTECLRRKGATQKAHRMATQPSPIPKQLRGVRTVSAIKMFGVVDHGYSDTGNGQTTDLGNPEGAQRAPRVRQAEEPPRKR